MFNQCLVTSRTCYACKDTIKFYSTIIITKKNNSMTTSERFLKVMDDLKINPYILEKEIGVKYAQAKISHYKKGVTKTISSDIIIQLCEAYPQVNANYILTGKGNMFLNNEENMESSTDIGAIGLTYDELARLYETTVSRYERLIEHMKMKFETLEHAFVDARETFNRESA